VESTGNKIFCLVDHPTYLTNIFVESYRMWDIFDETRENTEILLRQLYGMYQANLASKVSLKSTYIFYFLHSYSGIQ
jgi:hypothetical protein